MHDCNFLQNTCSGSTGQRGNKPMRSSGNQSFDETPPRVMDCISSSSYSSLLIRHRYLFAQRFCVAFNTRADEPEPCSSLCSGVTTADQLFSTCLLQVFQHFVDKLQRYDVELPNSRFPYALLFLRSCHLFFARVHCYLHGGNS
jgi:hypothetical protein